jgi:uncharacterized protein with beta-barrel porin domain
LTIDGDFVLNSGGVADIEMAGIANGAAGDTDSSELAITGSATLNGALDITLDASLNYAPGSFTVLNAEGGITGSYAVNVDSSETFGLDISYDTTSTSVVVTIALNPLTIPSGLSSNNLSLLKYLRNQLGNPDPFAAVYQRIAYFQSAGGVGMERLGAALNMVQPAINATATFVSSNVQFDALNILTSRSSTWRFWEEIKQTKIAADISQLEGELLAAKNFRSCTPKKSTDRYAVWFTPFGDISHANSSIDAETPFHTYTGGGLVGVDCRLPYSGIIESAIGAARSSVVLSQNLGHQTVNYYFAALNSTYTIDHFYLEAGLLAAYDQLENRRYIHIIGIDSTASSSHNMWQLTPELSFGYLFRINSWGVEPFVTEDWAFNFEGKVVEHGAGDLDTSTNARNSSLLRSEIGFNLYKNCTFTSGGGALLFRATGAYVNQVPFSVGAMQVSFLQVGTGSFLVNSFSTTQNLGTAGAEIVYSANSGIFGSIQYDGEFGRGYSANELQLQVGCSF